MTDAAPPPVLDPTAIATHVRAVHGYDYTPAAAARAAATVAAAVAALEAVAPAASHFGTEPADLATALAALAPVGE